MIKKVHLLVLAFSSLFMMTACSRETLPEQTPEEKGHFKIQFTNLSAGTKGFWEPDADRRKNGEACERTLNNISIFVYKNGDDVCAYRRDFSAHEILKKTAIFSLPEDVYDPLSKYDFYAVANYIYPAATAGSKGPKRDELVAATQADINDYMGITGAADGKFTDIYATTSGDAKALRKNVATGEGFVMSSAMVTAEVPADENTPRAIDLPISRLVNKTEIKAYTTPAFETNYVTKYGSKLTIDLVKITNIPTKSLLIASDTKIGATVSDYATISQVPGSETVSSVKQYYSVIYGFENNFSTAGNPSKRPELQILATYDFDGDPATTGDISKIVYKKELTLSGTGSLLRNTFYQVEVKINGLTSQEIITTIKILPWNTVAVENIEFGS